MVPVFPRAARALRAVGAVFVCLSLAGATVLRAADDAPGGGTLEAARELREIVVAQRAALVDLRKKADASEAEDVRPRLQAVVDRYEALLKKQPDFAAAWAAYGLLLCDPVLDERAAALPILLKANSLDGELPVVKNQLGVLLAESGRVPEALNYFLAASDLAPTEALYHFQIGLLIDEGDDALIKTGAWQRSVLEDTMLRAFARAVALAPDRHDFAYRAAEAFYDLHTPRWDEAYHAWSSLEQKLEGPLETQTVRLHRARVRWRQGFAADARELLGSVDAKELAGQRAKLQAEFDAEDASEAAAAKARAEKAAAEDNASALAAPPAPVSAAPTKPAPAQSNPPPPAPADLPSVVFPGAK